MNKVKIKRTPNGDTRTIEKLDKDLVYKDTVAHIEAVRDVLNEMAKELIKKGIMHDFTKLGEHFDEFFEAIESGKKGEEFYNLPWFKKHETMERHHLTRHEPDDVNLLDVIEMLVDISCAGMARSGEVYPHGLEPETIMKAVDNTLKLIQSNIEVIDEE